MWLLVPLYDIGRRGQVNAGNHRSRNDRCHPDDAYSGIRHRHLGAKRFISEKSSGRVALATKLPGILRHHFDARHYSATSDMWNRHISRNAKVSRPTRSYLRSIRLWAREDILLARQQTFRNLHHRLAVERNVH
jgi:hypothetical protein